ncbi:hypothetical protein [Amycolatopsis sp. NPDC003676]
MTVSGVTANPSRRPRIAIIAIELSPIVDDTGRGGEPRPVGIEAVSRVDR